MSVFFLSFCEKIFKLMWITRRSRNIIIRKMYPCTQLHIQNARPLAAWFTVTTKCHIPIFFRSWNKFQCISFFKSTERCNCISSREAITVTIGQTRPLASSTWCVIMRSNSMRAATHVEFSLRILRYYKLIYSAQFWPIARASQGHVTLPNIVSWIVNSCLL